MYCISCSVACKIAFCSRFSDIPDNTGKVTRKSRRTQAIVNHYAFHANAIIFLRHKVTTTGIHPESKTLEAIKIMPYPQNTQGII